MGTKKQTEGQDVKGAVQITAPNIRRIKFRIQGTAPYVQNKFSQKAKEAIHAKQASGSVSKKGAKKEAKDFQQAFEEATHKAPEGWFGIPAPAFRNAMISACRIVGFQMTKAKLAVFVEADGFDAEDSTPLIKIEGERKYSEMAVQNETGVVDLRPRPMWDAGWEADVTIRFDADMFTETDIANLMARVGTQVGVGAGRPDSKKSAGMGWGLFDLK